MLLLLYTSLLGDLECTYACISLSFECGMKSGLWTIALYRIDNTYSRSKKKKRCVITLQKNYRNTTVRTTHVLHKTTDRTTLNYAIQIIATTYKLSAHATDTNQVSCTQIRHSDVATYNLHTKLTWYILEMSIFAVALGYSSQRAIVILPLR